MPGCRIPPDAAAGWRVIPSSSGEHQDPGDDEAIADERQGDRRQVSRTLRPNVLALPPVRVICCSAAQATGVQQAGSGSRRHDQQQHRPVEDRHQLQTQHKDCRAATGPGSTYPHTRLGGSRDSGALDVGWPGRPAAGQSGPGVAAAAAAVPVPDESIERLSMMARLRDRLHFTSR